MKFYFLMALAMGASALASACSGADNSNGGTATSAAAEVNPGASGCGSTAGMTTCSLQGTWVALPPAQQAANVNLGILAGNQIVAVTFSWYHSADQSPYQATITACAGCNQETSTGYFGVVYPQFADDPSPPKIYFADGSGGIPIVDADTDDTHSQHMGAPQVTGYTENPSVYLDNLDLSANPPSMTLDGVVFVRQGN